VWALDVSGEWNGESRAQTQKVMQKYGSIAIGTNKKKRGGNSGA